MLFKKLLKEKRGKNDFTPKFIILSILNILKWKFICTLSRYATFIKIVHYDTSAIKLFLTSVSLQHEPKVSDVIRLVKKTFFARVSYEILYHEVWKWGILHTEWYKHYYNSAHSKKKYLFGEMKTTILRKIEMPIFCVWWVWNWINHM